MKKPDDCGSMDDVRAEIDRIDRGLVDLLAERDVQGLRDAAAEVAERLARR